MRSKEQVASELIRDHFNVEPYLTEVWRILTEDEASPTEPIKLLEVNVATVATGSITPFAFAPTRDVPYSTMVAEVTPEEFASARVDPSTLPLGWSLSEGRATRFERPAA